MVSWSCCQGACCDKPLTRPPTGHCQRTRESSPGNTPCKCGPIRPRTRPRLTLFLHRFSSLSHTATSTTCSPLYVSLPAFASWSSSNTAQPRFAISPGHEHKAFIPLTAVFSEAPDPTRHQVARARAVALHPHSLTLDREFQGSQTLPFDYLVVATGTRLAAPGTMPSDDKPASVRYLQTYQSSIRASPSIAIIGGGAVGVQMACDLKELYPSKSITLIHSRAQLMPAYHPALSDLIKTRLAELDITLLTNTRVALDTFPNNGTPTTLYLQSTNAPLLTADHIITATGQTPNTSLLSTLPPSDPDVPLINPANGFIRVRPTLQFADARYPQLFAVGDVADTGAHKAARPGAVQAGVAARNIVAQVLRAAAAGGGGGGGSQEGEKLVVGAGGIHLTLGLVSAIFFLFCACERVCVLLGFC